MNRTRHGGLRRGFVGLAAIAIAVLLAGRQIAAAPSDPPAKRLHNAPGEELFATNAPVLRLKIDVAPADVEKLRDEPRKYVPAAIREGDLTYTNVGVHLKGAAGSFRPWDDKPALTLSFNKFNPNQRFHGLRKLHVNNSVQDPSYSTENICGWMFRSAGIPAARVTNARVWLNGRDLGFFVVIEGFTKDFLNEHFQRNDGNLYDGGFLRDVNSALEQHGGSGADHADLKALAAAAREPDAGKRWERLNQVLDMDRFLTYLALDVLIWDWDGYAMKRNNYWIYHDPTTRRLVFIPHGMDQMFWDAHGPLDPYFDGLVANAVVETRPGNRLYRRRLSDLFEQVYQVQVLTNLVESIHARNRPAVAELGVGALQDYDNAVSEVSDRIVRRWKGVREQLKEQATGSP